MAFIRDLIQEGSNLPRKSRAGDGIFAALPTPASVTNSATGASTIPVVAILAGLYYRTGLTAGASDTTPTAAQLDAFFDGMEVGDTWLLVISVQVAFALTLTAGTGITLAGKTSVPASGLGWFLLQKTATSGAYTLTGL